VRDLVQVLARVRVLARVQELARELAPQELAQQPEPAQLRPV
jgi:hypothetical protein